MLRIPKVFDTLSLAFAALVAGARSDNGALLRELAARRAAHAAGARAPRGGFKDR